MANEEYDPTVDEQTDTPAVAQEEWPGTPEAPRHMGRRELVHEGIKQTGATPVAQAAFMGDIEQESNFNARAVSDHGTSVGLFQTGRPMYGNYRRDVQPRSEEEDLYLQPQYVIEQWKRRHPDRWKAMNEAPNAAEAEHIYRSTPGWGYGIAGRRYQHAMRYQQALGVQQLDVPSLGGGDQQDWPGTPEGGSTEEQEPDAQAKSEPPQPIDPAVTPPEDVFLQGVLQKHLKQGAAKGVYPRAEEIPPEAGHPTTPDLGWPEADKPADVYGQFGIPDTVAQQDAERARAAQRTTGAEIEPEAGQAVMPPEMVDTLKDVWKSGVRQASRGAAAANPIVGTLEAIPQTRFIAEGIKEGVGELGAGFIGEPDNLALIAASEGLGLLPVGAGVAGRAVSGYFAYQMAKQMPEYWQAFKDAPDAKTQVAVATQAIGTLVMSGQAGFHAVGPGGGPPGYFKKIQAGEEAKARAKGDAFAKGFEEGRQEEPAPAENPHNASRDELDQRAQDLGHDDARRFNMQNVLKDKSQLSPEEQQLLVDIGEHGKRVSAERDPSVIADMNEEDYNRWHKVNAPSTAEAGGITRGIDSAVIGVKAARERGDTRTEDRLTLALKLGNLRDNWTIEAWKEATGDTETQAEIDQRNANAREHNDELNAARDELGIQYPMAKESKNAKVTTPGAGGTVTPITAEAPKFKGQPSTLFDQFSQYMREVQPQTGTGKPTFAEWQRGQRKGSIGKLPEPVVPGTGAEDRSRTMLDEIRDADANTTAKVQALFARPDQGGHQFTREQAAELRRQAWGEHKPREKGQPVNKVLQGQRNKIAQRRFQSDYDNLPEGGQLAVDLERQHQPKAIDRMSEDELHAGIQSLDAELANTPDTPGIINKAGLLRVMQVKMRQQLQKLGKAPPPRTRPGLIPQNELGFREDDQGRLVRDAEGNIIQENAGSGRFPAIENSYHIAYAAEQEHPGVPLKDLEVIWIFDERAGRPGNRPVVANRIIRRGDKAAKDAIDKEFPSTDDYSQSVSTPKPYKARKGDVPSYEEWKAKKKPPTAPPEPPTTPGAPPVVPRTGPAAPPVTGFQTSSGSHYEVHDDGTTSRNKAPRADHPDHGPKERSAKTVYVTPENMRLLALPASGWRLIDHGDGTFSLATMHQGKLGIPPSSRNIPVLDTPALGLHPLELWDKKQVKGQDAYAKAHIGNDISSLGPPKAAALDLETLPPDVNVTGHGPVERLRDEAIKQLGLKNWARGSNFSNADDAKIQDRMVKLAKAHPDFDRLFELREQKVVRGAGKGGEALWFHKDTGIPIVGPRKASLEGWETGQPTPDITNAPPLPPTPRELQSGATREEVQADLAAGKPVNAFDVFGHKLEDELPGGYVREGDNFEKTAQPSKRGHYPNRNGVYDHGAADDYVQMTVGKLAWQRNRIHVMELQDGNWIYSTESGLSGAGHGMSEKFGTYETRDEAYEAAIEEMKAGAEALLARPDVGKAQAAAAKKTLKWLEDVVSRHIMMPTERFKKLYDKVVAEEKAEDERVPFVAPHPREMTHAQINNELDRLDKTDVELSKELTAAGRGREMPAEIRTKDDMLSKQFSQVLDRKQALIDEAARRLGGVRPSLDRLPVGKYSSRNPVTLIPPDKKGTNPPWQRPAGAKKIETTVVKPSTLPSNQDVDERIAAEEDFVGPENEQQIKDLSAKIARGEVRKPELGNAWKYKVGDRVAMLGRNHVTGQVVRTRMAAGGRRQNIDVRMDHDAQVIGSQGVHWQPEDSVGPNNPVAPTLPPELKKEVQKLEKKGKTAPTTNQNMVVQKKYLLKALDDAIQAAPAVPEFEMPDDLVADRKALAVAAKERQKKPYSDDSNAALKADQDQQEMLSDQIDKYGLTDWKVKELVPGPEGIGGTGPKQNWVTAEREPKHDELMKELETRIKSAEDKAVPKVVIEVPGDGTFSIVNSKEALKTFRKAAAKDFPSTLAKSSEPSKGKSTKPSQIPAVGSKSKSLEDKVKVAAIASSDDKTRYVLENTVFSTGDKLVATDGRRMIIIDEKGPKDRILDGTTAKERTDWGEDDQGKKNPKPTYPNYKAVIPEKKDMKKVATIDTADGIKLMKQAQQLMAEGKKEKDVSVKLWVDKNGKLGVTAKTPEVGEFAGGEADPKTAKYLMTLNPSLFADGLRIARGLGHEKVELWVKSTETEMSPASLEAKGMRYIQMPMRMNDGGEYKKGKYEPGPEPVHPMSPEAQTTEAEVASREEAATLNPDEHTEMPGAAGMTAAEEKEAGTIPGERGLTGAEEDELDSFYDDQGVRPGLTKEEQARYQELTDKLDAAQEEEQHGFGGGTRKSKKQQGFQPGPTNTPAQQNATMIERLAGHPLNPIGIVKSLLSGLAPGARGPKFLEAANELGRHLGRMHRRGEISMSELKSHEKMFTKLGVDREGQDPEQNIGNKFASDLSMGRPIHPEFQAAWDTVEKLLKSKLYALHSAGAGLKALREHYFPGMWDQRSRTAFNAAIEEAIAQGVIDKNANLNRVTPEQAAWIKDRTDRHYERGTGNSDRDMIGYLSKRPMRGRESFRKQKIFEDYLQAQRLGLRPVSYNPITVMKLKFAELDRSIMAHEYFQALKQKGLMEVIGPWEQVPEGWQKVPDPYGEIIGPPTVTIKEWLDRGVYDGLEKALTNIGGYHIRKIGIGGQRLGYAQSGAGGRFTEGKTVTRFGTETSVLAHEVGHQLDFKFGLWDTLVRGAEGVGARGEVTKAASREARVKINNELRAIADLTGRGQYARKQVEKMAQVLEAYIHAPDLMKEVAPTVYSKFDEFIKATPQIAHLAELRPGLLLKQLESQKYVGMPIMGVRIIPSEHALIMDNYLSKSLYNSQYIGALYKGWMGAANAINQSQLGMGSAFHLTFTLADAVTSNFANILKDGYGVMTGSRTAEDLVRTTGRAIGTVVRTPYLGDKVLNAWRNSEPSMDARIVQVVRAGELAGAGFELQKGLETEQWGKMMKDWYSGRKVKGLLRSPVAVTEALAWPIMKWWVPRLKAGVFADMAWRVIEQNPGKTMEEMTPQFRQVWNRVDSRLGQVVYDRTFMRNTAKNTLQALIRAPGWTGGTIVEVGGAFPDAAKFVGDWIKDGHPPRELPDRVAYTMALLIGSTVTNALLTYAFTGERPRGLDFWAFRDGGTDEYGNPTRLMLPTYMKDILSYIEHPGTTLGHKTHPLLSVANDVILQNKDYYGTEIRHPDDPYYQQAGQVGKYLLKSFEPFWWRGLRRQYGQQGGVKSGAVESYFGIMPAPRSLTETDAEHYASERVRAMLPQGARTQAQAEHSQNVKEVIRDIQLKRTTIQEALRSGRITQSDKKNVEFSSRAPALTRAIAHLGPEDVYGVWKRANLDERKQIRQLFLTKIQHSKTLTRDRKSELLHLMNQ